jgi:hypothetical protein
MSARDDFYSTLDLLDLVLDAWKRDANSESIMDSALYQKARNWVKENRYCQNCKYYQCNFFLGATFCHKKERYLETIEARENFCDDWEIDLGEPKEERT